jgi:hypothetical protein
MDNMFQNILVHIPAMVSDPVLTFVENRMVKIKEWMPEAEQARKNSDCEHVRFKS